MKKQQLHEVLAVLLTKLSSARDDPLLIDNYSVKALRTDYNFQNVINDSFDYYDTTLKKKILWNGTA